MNIQGFQKTTLLDYPRHVAATIFVGGCNFRCPFCHNKDLVLSPPSIPAFEEDEVLAYLKKRKNILDGVCVTGGEPTLQPDLPVFLEKIKALGLSVKLDTNGYRPDILKNLCTNGLIDYMAMDVKASPGKYAAVCGLSQIKLEQIFESVEFLKEGQLPYEFRTTVVKELHEKEDFFEIGIWLKGARAYYLQAYQDSPQVISPGFSSYEKEKLEEFATLLRPYISTVEIRGMEL